MQFKRSLIVYSALAGLGVWFFDTAVDAIYFYEGSFLSLLVFEVPTHELYIRTVILVTFLGFGVTVAWLVGDLESRGQDLELFRSLIDEANDSVFVIDPNTGKFLDVNARACEMLGYDRSELLSMGVADISPTVREHTSFQGFIQSPEREVMEREETEHERADGSRIPIEMSAKTVEIEEEPYRIAIGRDISERKEQERQLRSLIGNLPGMAYQCRNERGWPMDIVRGQCQELVGYSAERIETGEVSWGDDIIKKDDRERVWEEVQERIRNHEPFELTYRIQTADNEEKWVWERGELVRPLHVDEPKLEGFISDITERKQLEEELREAKEKYESLFNSIRDAILVADTDRRITHCNPAFTDVFGYELAEIEGKPTKFIYESEEQFEQMGEAIEDHITDPRFTYTVNYEKKSGQVFPGETNVFYLHTSNGEVDGFIGLIRDVSDRVQRNKQLQVIDRILRHNLRNDMTVIRGQAELVKSGHDDIESNADKIIEMSDELAATADKEREIAKCLARDPSPEPTDIMSTAESVIAELEDRYPAASLTLSGSLECEVLATPDIGRAITELVENAIGHSDQPEPEVTVRVHRTDETVTVNIEDRGSGIPEMERNVITEDADIAPIRHGSGLGLRLVDVIVRQSGGVVRFRENEPRGSIVSIQLQAW